MRAADGTVRITDSAYDPVVVTVTAGSVVTWNDTGTKTHTVTADDGSFDSGNLDPGQAFGNLFGTAGTFAYHDTADPELRGSAIAPSRCGPPQAGPARPNLLPHPGRSRRTSGRRASRRRRPRRARRHPGRARTIADAHLDLVDPVVHRRRCGDRPRPLLRSAPATAICLKHELGRENGPAKARAVRSSSG